MDHVAWHLTVKALARVIEVVPLRLLRDGGSDRLAQRCVVTRMREQRGAQVGAILLPETHEDFTRAGDPHTVAAFAEVVAERRDEADLLAGLLQPDVARGSPRALGEVGDGVVLGLASPDVL